MKLYIAPASPYVRMVLIVIDEKGLRDRIEVIEGDRLRTPDSPYYDVNPSGRVPYLVRDDGVGLEQSDLIITYLDHLDGQPVFDQPAGDHGWEIARLEATAKSLLDGVAVWSRELRRGEQRRSPKNIYHEASRFYRLADYFEQAIGHPVFQGDLNRAQITLACGLGFASACAAGCELEIAAPGFEWRESRPRLSAWYEKISGRSAFARNPAITLVIR